MEFDRDELKNAIETDQLLLNYQPILSLDQVRVAGFESLIRWQHPELGLVAPGKFLPDAERHDLLVEIGNWVLQKSLEDWQEWLEKGLVNETMFLSMNCSHEEVSSLDFVNILEDTFENGERLPNKFYIELHEKTMDELHDSNPDIVNRIWSIPAIDLCVDNFGSKEPSLQKLAEWPTSILKFDRQFVNPSHDLEYHSAIVERLISFARERGLTVIAEGVESQELFEDLYDWGCEYVQGFYIARPIDVHPSESMDENELEALVSTLGRRRPQDSDRLEVDVNIHGNPHLLLAGPSNPVRELLQRCVEEQNLSFQTVESIDEISERVGKFVDDIVVLDNRLGDSERLRSLIATIWDRNPETYFIYLSKLKDDPISMKLGDDDRLEVLEKPVDRTKFLQILSNQSYHLDRMTSDESVLSRFTRKLPRTSIRFYFVLLIGFTLFGLAMGYALTSLRENFTQLFQPSRSMDKKIEKLRDTLEKRDELKKKLKQYEEYKRNYKKN